MFQQGNVELRNIRLRPEAFNASDAPFEVVAGTAGYMKLKLPWQNLGKQPVIIEMDRVYLLAREEPLDGKKHSGKDDEAQLYAKRSELESQEAAWLSSRYVISIPVNVAIESMHQSHRCTFSSCVRPSC